MAELSAKLFRDYFGGSWFVQIYKNGDFQREFDFNWPAVFGEYSSIGNESEAMGLPNGGVLDNTNQVAIAGWHNDVRRWIHRWHNEFGGYGELQWTSQDDIEGLKVLHGFIHECKQEGDDPTEHIIKCEMYDRDNFKYIIHSFRKGLTEIVAKRIKTAEQLKKMTEKQTHIKKGIEKLKKVDK